MALILAGGAAMMGSGVYYELTRTKAGDVKSMMEERLPRGASTDQIFRFLDSHSIEHSSVGPGDLGDRTLQEHGLSPGGMTIKAIVRNDGYTLKLVDVEITLILDERGLLKDFVVREVGR